MPCGDLRHCGGHWHIIHITGDARNRHGLCPAGFHSGAARCRRNVRLGTGFVFTAHFIARQEFVCCVKRYDCACGLAGFRWNEGCSSPVRNILDTDPIYSAVTVDTRLNEVYLQDPNTWSIRVFGRLDNTPPEASRTEARRVIGGPKTDLQFNSCVYVDPKNGDIYSVEDDIGDAIVVFKNNANGDPEPIRKLN